MSIGPLAVECLAAGLVGPLKCVRPKEISLPTILAVTNMGHRTNEVGQPVPAQYEQYRAPHSGTSQSMIDWNDSRTELVRRFNISWP